VEFGVSRCRDPAARRQSCQIWRGSGRGLRIYREDVTLSAVSNGESNDFETVAANLATPAPPSAGLASEPVTEREPGERERRSPDWCGDVRAP
jgi:hypothetical protein